MYNVFLCLSLTVGTLDNHCIRTVQSLRGGCSRRVHKIVYLAVKNDNILVNILLLKLFIANYCHINPAVYLLMTFLWIE